MSKIPTLIDALVSVFRSAPALSGMEVVDGPVMTDSALPDWLLVGFDGDPEGEFIGATTENEWTDLSVGRGEQITIPVAVVVTRGETDVKAARDAAFAYYSVISDILRADPTIGVPQTQVTISTCALIQAQMNEGIQTRLALSVHCSTLG